MSPALCRAAILACAALLATPAGALEKLGVVAVADPPVGPDADLAELTHQLRAACRDRIGGVEDVPTMRARLLGQSSNATLSELDRAYGGALAVYQNGEFESALRTLHAIVDDLESLPESDDAYAQWVRARLRLAHAALTIGREAEADGAFFALARTDLAIAADADQYSPSYRRRFDGVKAKVRALQARRLTVAAEGREGTVFVNGRPMGTTPLALWLPAGTYRIGGASGDLRVPSFQVDLRAEPRTVVLDFALAGSLRVNAGPGLALPVARRGDGIVRAGAWLGVDRVVAVSRVYEGEAAFLLGSIFDVRRGALLREGSVRMIAGSVPAANLGALAAFLLTGQSSRDVKDRTGAGIERVHVADAARPIPGQDGARSAPAPQAAGGEAALPAAPARGGAAVVVAPDEATLVGRAPAPSAKAPSAVANTAREKHAAAPAGTPPAPAGRHQRAAAPAPPETAPANAPPPERAATVPAIVQEGAHGDGGASASASPATGDATAGAPASEAGRGSPSLAVVPRPVIPSPVDGVDRAARPRRWLRPAAYGAGGLAGVLAGLALQQGLAARSASADADAMVSGGVFVPGTSASDVARYHELRSDADAARRNAYLSAGAAAAFAAAAGFLGWRSLDRDAPDAAPSPALAFRF